MVPRGMGPEQSGRARWVRHNHLRHDDPGLQPERTSLSWSRTLLALVLVSTLFVRWAGVHLQFVIVMLVLTVTVAGAIYVSRQRWHARGVAGIQADHIHPNLRSVFGLSVAVTLVGLVGVAAVIAGP